MLNPTLNKLVYKVHTKEKWKILAPQFTTLFCYDAVLEQCLLADELAIQTRLTPLTALRQF